MAQSSETFARFVAGRRLHLFFMLFGAGGVRADLARRAMRELEPSRPAEFRQSKGASYPGIARNEYDHARFLIGSIVSRLLAEVGPGPELDVAKEALVALSKGVAPEQAIAMAQKVNVAAAG